MVAKRVKPSKMSLLRKVAELSGVRFSDVFDVYAALLYVMFNEAAHNSVARLPGLLEITLKEMGSRKFKSNLTKELVDLPDRVLPKVRLYPNAKMMLQGRLVPEQPECGGLIASQPQDTENPPDTKLGVVAEVSEEEIAKAEESLEAEESIDLETLLNDAAQVGEEIPQEEIKTPPVRRLWEHVQFANEKD